MTGSSSLARWGCAGKTSIDRLVRPALRRRLLPDATIGTNGPVATVGTPPEIDAVASALRARGRDPAVVGELVADGDGALVNATGRSLDSLVESLRLRDRPEPTNGPDSTDP